MDKIIEFNCTYDNATGIRKEVMEDLNLKFPDAYLHWDTMAEISKAIKKYENAAFCELPFCHTVEAEAMGGHVNYGNEIAGPRAKEYICTSMEEILKLPEIDYDKGRIHEVLLACKDLKEQGEEVVLEVAGPFTILNVLLDAKYVFKALKKKPELAEKVFWKIGNEMLRYIEAAQDYGVELISYADSSGGVNILGPSMAEQVVECFTYKFLKEVEKICKLNTMVLLCPKTTFALLGTKKAQWRDIPLETPMRYGEACLAMKNRVTFSGQMCIKNIEYHLKDGVFKEVVLK